MAMMLRAQGFTIRQICDKLKNPHSGKAPSTQTIFKDIKESIERINLDTDSTTRSYRAMLLEQCDEDFGLLAELMDETDKKRLGFEKRAKLKLLILDRRGDVREDVIDIVGLRKVESTTTSAGEILGIIAKGLGHTKDNGPT
jgi:hypothetical protein